jgi:hypothetical protein
MYAQMETSSGYELRAISTHRRTQKNGNTGNSGNSTAKSQRDPRGIEFSKMEKRWFSSAGKWKSNTWKDRCGLGGTPASWGSPHNYIQKRNRRGTVSTGEQGQRVYICRAKGID